MPPQMRALPTSYSREALGRYAEIIPVAQRGVELARTSGLGGPRGEWMASYWLICLAALGRWREAEELAVGLRDLTDGTTEDLSLASVAVILIRQGRLDEARPVVERLRSIWERTKWAETLASAVVPVIMFDAAEGRVDGAVDLVERQLERRGGIGDIRSEVVATGIAVLADHTGPQPSRRDRQSASQATATAGRWLACIDDVDSTAPAPTIVMSAHRDHARANFARLRGESDDRRWSALVARWVELGFPYEEADARHHLAVQPARRRRSTR